VNARNFRRALAAGGAALVLSLLAACGGGGGGGSSSTSSNGPTLTNPAVSLPIPEPLPANAALLVVDTGTDGSSVNSPFVSVTVCVPGTSTCQTIDHIMVDTGSYGLRLAASALNGTMTLPPVAAPGGEPLAECAGFVSGYAWGSVRSADVQISGEQALGVPVQVVNDPASPYAAVPTACSNTGPTFGVGAGAKGILGVGFQAQDCGAPCVSSASPLVYFACPTTGCVSTAAPLASQVTNPVPLFPTDNNGVTIALPNVPLGGVPSATGLLIFGVGTAANNQIGAARVYTANAAGNFTTVYKGRTLSAFLDSGSNGIFFNDASFTECTGGFYCPASATSLTATITGANGTSTDVSFVVENARTISTDAGAAYLAGSLGSSRSMDWGLPFFFGRTVFVAMQGASTPFGTGPFWAF
jgi:hypothetical protein